MKPANMPQRVERRRANAARRAGLPCGSHEIATPTTDIKFRLGRNKRPKVARKFMGPNAEAAK